MPRGCNGEQHCYRCDRLIEMCVRDGHPSEGERDAGPHTPLAQPLHTAADIRVDRVEEEER